MIRPKEGKGVFQSFLVSGFSMMFVWYFFRPPWPMQSVLLSHLHMCRMEERITAFLFSKCSKIRLLTFDLYLAVEQLRVFSFFSWRAEPCSPLSPLLRRRRLWPEQTSPWTLPAWGSLRLFLCHCLVITSCYKGPAPGAGALL